MQELNELPTPTSVLSRTIYNDGKALNLHCVEEQLSTGLLHTHNFFKTEALTVF